MKKTIILLLCLLPLCFAYAAKQPLIIDTDAGTDDAIAILYLLKNPQINVKAVIVDINGSSFSQTAANHIALLLKILGKSQTPIYIGMNKPVNHGNTYPQYAKKLMDDSYKINDIQPNVKINKSQLLTLISQSKQPMTLLSLGSLTNIADLLSSSPTVKKHISNIMVMGGAVHVPGNINAFMPKTKNYYAEWNIYVDPDSFKQVLETNVPVTLVSLDITNKVPVTEKFMQTLSQHLSTPSAQFVYDMLKENDTYIKAGEYDFWDPLAAYLTVHPVKTKTEKVNVNLTPGNHYGQVYADKNGYVIQMIPAIDQQNLEQTLIKVLSN